MDASTQTRMSADAPPNTSLNCCGLCHTDNGSSPPHLAHCTRPVPTKQHPWWPKKFVEGQHIKIYAYNRSYIDSLKTEWEREDSEAESDASESGDDGGTDEDDESDVEADEAMHKTAGPLKEKDDSIARIFMRGRLHHSSTEIEVVYDNQAKAVEDFCDHIVLRDLEEDSPTKEKKHCVLLDERTACGKFRTNWGRMNYTQLGKALRIDRFVTDRSQDPRQNDSYLLPNADQRRLYIHNITPCVAATLMATTSVHEAQPVRDLLHLHISAEPEIRVSIPSMGFRTFSFVVSLPSFTKQRRLARDTRDVVPAQPRRKSITIALPSELIHTSPPDCSSYTQFVRLQETQTTLVVTGPDESRWTAIGLIDSDRLEDSVSNYQSKALTGGKMHQQDPITRGRLAAKCNINPRHFFLRAWEAHIHQVDIDWDGVVKSVDRAVKLYRLAENRMWNLASQHAESNNFIKRLRNSINRKAQLKSELTPLGCSLSCLVRCWHQFDRGHIKYFHDTNETDLDDVLRIIREIYARLETKLATLERLMEELDDNHVNHVLAAEGFCVTQALSNQNLELTRTSLRLAQEQERSAQMTRNVTKASVCFLPLVLVSGLFGVESTALPFVPNTQAFYCALCIFVAATLLLVNYLDSTCQWLLSKSAAGRDLWGFLSNLGGLLLEKIASMFPFFGRRGQPQPDVEELPPPALSRSVTWPTVPTAAGMAA